METSGVRQGLSWSRLLSRVLRGYAALGAKGNLLSKITIINGPEAFRLLVNAN